MVKINSLKMLPLFINNIRYNKALPVYGDGLFTRDWLHVKDHARAIDIIYHQGKQGDTYNIGGLTSGKISICKICARLWMRNWEEKRFSEKLLPM